MRRFAPGPPLATSTLRWVIGLPEILVLAVIVLLVFGYKRLPQLGRSAGEGVRTGIDKAKGLSDSVGDKVDGKVDPQSIGRSAGKGLREAREFRDALTGKETPKPAAKAPPPTDTATSEPPAEASTPSAEKPST
jgi:sec-independent protein translocase protein TatA